MASESGGGETGGRDTFGVVDDKKVKSELSRMAWEGQRDRVRVP